MSFDEFIENEKAMGDQSAEEPTEIESGEEVTPSETPDASSEIPAMEEPANPEGTELEGPKPEVEVDN